MTLQTMPRAICLAGPTAAGKTAAAMAIADRYEVEIISVDSALVYRGMDIGTAKPTSAELGAVPHHLIDIRDPLNAYSAAEFVQDAERVMLEIASRGKLPLLVGGTMLYFKALFDGLDDMPKANAKLREEMAAQAAQQGWPALHAELALVDAVTAARLKPNDSQRISRALEVYKLSGQPLSWFHHKHAIDNIASSARKTCATALISLEPDHRSWLHERIARRFDAMLAAGLVDEVKALHSRGDLHADLPSMRCVGYRQVLEVLNDQSPASTLRDKGIFATRQLAKRQITWLRSMPERNIVACDAPDAINRVLELVESKI